MCPVQWRKPSPGTLTLPFLLCPPEQVLAILEPPSAYACIELHFPEGGRGSVPCLGETDCHHHHHPLKCHAYTVAAHYQMSSRIWRFCIVDLGFFQGEAATTDYRGLEIRVGRENKQDRRSNLRVITSKDLHAESPVLKLQAPDVRPLLMRRWGLFDEATRLTREAYYEQERLPFDADLKGKGEAS